MSESPVAVTDNLPDLESLSHEQLVKMVRSAQEDAHGWRVSAEEAAGRCVGLEAQLEHANQRINDLHAQAVRRAH